jgi:hypothetical protein
VNIILPRPAGVCLHGRLSSNVRPPRFTFSRVRATKLHHQMKQPKHVKRAKVNAWLLTWEGTSGVALDPDRKIIAILDARRSESFVAGLVDVIYSRSHSSAYDMAFMVNKRHLRDRQYKHVGVYPSHVLYGHLPCIFARKVIDLTITLDTEAQIEHLRWTEPPVFGNAPVGAGIVEIVAARELEHTRSAKPLSRDRTEA